MMRGGTLTVSHDLLTLFKSIGITLSAKRLIAGLNIINATAGLIRRHSAT